MWVFMGAAYFAAAILLNTAVSRVTSLPPLANFLLSGSLVGLVIIGHALLAFDAPVFVLATVLSYAAACELFLIVITALVSSIAVRSIRYLGTGPMSESELAELYDAHNMVKLRLDRVRDAGLAERNKRSWRLTAKGKRLLSVLKTLRAFFGHSGSM